MQMVHRKSINEIEPLVGWFWCFPHKIPSHNKCTKSLLPGKEKMFLVMGLFCFDTGRVLFGVFLY